jgi:hypothetical protein
MNDSLHPEINKRLTDSSNIWLATVRPDLRPHLVPVWFIHWNDRFFLCIEPGSVKSNNLTGNPAVVLALEDGSKPIICEGFASAVENPWPEEVIGMFKGKYDWDIRADEQYSLLVRIKPLKWLSW